MNATPSIKLNEKDADERVRISSVLGYWQLLKNKAHSSQLSPSTSYMMTYRYSL